MHHIPKPYTGRHAWGWGCDSDATFYKQGPLYDNNLRFMCLAFSRRYNMGNQAFLIPAHADMND